jgi:selenocysteine-specific elongation factor
MAHMIIGTAGHIDHGKSALVKALTGTDPDRLQEEKKRGLTIDLGFAFLDKDIAIIDVPGHEKFVKNMVAGVSTIDFAILVIAADDSVMPQTREHFDILKLLDVANGMIVINKCDLVDNDLMQLVKEDVSDLVRNTFLQDADTFIVSSTTGEGIDALRSYLLELPGKIKPHTRQGLFWMPVDRCFSIKGFGTVVTGSVLSGSVGVGETVERIPGRFLKIRNIQSHGNKVEQVAAGERAALNLHNITKEEIKRGDVLATPDYFKPTNRLDATLHLLKSAPKTLKNRVRVRLHLGTKELFARLTLLDQRHLLPGESAYVQLHLEKQTATRRRERYVIRQYSPAITIGGGIVLDDHPAKHRRFDSNTIKQLKQLEKQNPKEIISLTLLNTPYQCLGLSELARQSGLLSEDIKPYIDKLVNDDDITVPGKGNKSVYTHSLYVRRLSETIIKVISDFHDENPLKAGISRAELKENSGTKISPILFDYVLQKLVAEKQLVTVDRWIKRRDHEIRLSAEQKALADQIEALLLKSPFMTPSLQEIAAQIDTPVQDIEKVTGALQGLNKVIRAEGNLYFHQNAIEKAEQLLIDLSKKQEKMSVSEFREMLNTTRKFAMGLLDYFDAKGRTERVGDTRVIHSK